MCTVQVEVLVVEPHQLAGTWAAVTDAMGRRVLIVRRTATPVEVAEGYHAAQRRCPVRIAFTSVA